MKALIMAGGEGTRLRPLTCDRPKPMVDFLGKPLLQYSLELLKKHGISEVGMTLLFMGEKIRSFFGDGSEMGMNIRYFPEKEPMGTAGSVKNAESFLDERFLVLSGDALSDLDIGSALESHMKSKAPVTIILKKVENPLEYGIALLNGENRITEFFEKPAWSEVFSDAVNTGSYIIEPEILSYIPKNRPFDFSKDLFPLLLKNGIPLNGHITQSYWCDVGNTEAYIRALGDALSGKVQLTPNAAVKNGLFIGKDVKISPSAVLQAPCYIGSGSIIENFARIGEGSVIGENVFIGQGANIKKSYVGSASSLMENVKLSRAVLCGNNHIGKEARILENAVVGSGTHIASSAVILPCARIWPEKWIESGSVVRKNIVWGFGNRSDFFHENGIFGEFGSEIEAADILKAGAVLAKHSESCILGHDGLAQSKYLMELFASGYIGTGKRVCLAGETLPPVLEAKKEADSIGHALYFKTEGSELSIESMFGSTLARQLSRDHKNGTFPMPMRLGEKTYADSLHESYLSSLPKGYFPFVLAEKNTPAAMLLASFAEKQKPLFSVNIGKDAKTGFLKHADAELGGDLLITAIFETALTLFGAKPQKVFLDTPSSALQLIKRFGADYSLSAKPSESTRMLRDFPYFVLCFAKRLTKDSLSLSEYIALLPKSRRFTAELACEWRDIGKVIAKVAENNGQTELSRGLRIKKDGAEILLCAGALRPSIRLISEAASFEAAQESARELSQEIRKILSE